MAYGSWSSYKTQLVYSTSGYDYYVIWRYKQDPVANKTTYSACQVKIVAKNGYSVYNHNGGTIGMGVITENRKTQTFDINIPRNGSQTYNIADVGRSFSHESDGSLSSTYGANLHVYANGNVGGQYDINTGGWKIKNIVTSIPKIDRNRPNVTVKQKSNDLYSVTLEYTSNYCASYGCYRINGGSWQYFNPNGTNVTNGGTGTVTINNLSPSTSYNIELELRRDYNELWSKAATCTITTKAGTSSITRSLAGQYPGKSISFSIDRKSSAYTHNVAAFINGSWFADIDTGVGTSASWTIPYSLIEKYPNSDITATIYCETFNGSTSIGMSSTTITIYHYSPSDFSLSGKIIGGETTVSISSKCDKFMHTIDWSLAGPEPWHTVASNIVTSKVFTADSNILLKSCPDSDTATLYVRVITKYGNIQIGNNITHNINMNVPASIVPTAPDTLSVTEGNAKVLTSIGALFVQNNSIASLTISGGTPSTGSSFLKYVTYMYHDNVVIDQKEGSNPQFLLPKYGTVTFKSWYYDKRGRYSSEKVTSINVAPYNLPSLNECLANRIQPDSTVKAKVAFSASSLKVDSVEKNAVNIEIWYKSSTDATLSKYTTITKTVGEALNVETDLTNINPSKSYIIEFRISDKLQSGSKYSVSISTAKVPFEFDVKNGAISIGTRLNRDASNLPLHTLELNGSICINGNDLIEILQLFNSIIQEISLYNSDVSSKLLRLNSIISKINNKQ